MTQWLRSALPQPEGALPAARPDSNRQAAKRRIIVFTRIMAPVDLAHADRLEKALTAAAELAKLWRIPVCYVGVTAETPGAVAHSPAEYAEKLEAFGRSQAERHGHEATVKAYASHDPAADVDATLLKAVEETGADLVVMASHEPGVADYLFSSHGASLAADARASVFVVR